MKEIQSKSNKIIIYDFLRILKNIFFIILFILEFPIIFNYINGHSIQVDMKKRCDNVELGKKLDIDNFKGIFSFTGSEDKDSLIYSENVGIMGLAYCQIEIKNGIVVSKSDLF